MFLALASGFAAGYMIPETFTIENVMITTMAAGLVAAAALFFIKYAKKIPPTIDVFNRYRFLLANLISRDLKVKYRRSVLGFFWSILNPLMMALVINAVFSHFFRFQMSDDKPFIIYYLTGSLIFNFMNEATTTSLTSVLSASTLIQKVYIPKYVFPLEKCMFAFVNMMLSSVALIIVMLIKRMSVSYTILLFFVPMILVFIFSLGLSLMLSSVNVFFRDVVMYGVIPGWKSLAMCVLYAFTFLALGLLIFKKQQDKFILYI